MNALEQILASASEPPSDLPTWQWLEQNVELSPVDTDLPGNISFEFFPASRFFFDRLDNPRTRRVTVMKCSQSAFTQNAVMHILRRIKDRPVTTMWIGNAAEKTQEDAKKRFWPAIQSCKAIQHLCPDEGDKERWTSKLIMFDTMNLMIRGSNAVSGLRGDPAGLIVCDERADWVKGRIHKARQRLSTKSAPVEISIGAAGNKDDELHTDWKEGSQTFVHFTCPHCQHSQPFRFSKKQSVLFPEPRALGGLVWDEKEIAWIDGALDEERLKKTVRYECEHCGHLFENSDKSALLKTCHEHHRNPRALPEHYSLQVSGLMLIWGRRSWGDIAVEHIKAIEAMKHGDIEPLLTFVQETLGEPWELRNPKQNDSELLDRCGDYTLGQFWADPQNKDLIEPGTALVLTFDRQQFELVYVVRQWRRNGQSRLVWCGTLPSYEDLRVFQIEKRIKDKAVWGDDGGQMTQEFRQTCLRYNWNAMKGEDYRHYTFHDEKTGREWRQGWRMTEFDPGIGTSHQGRISMRAWLWSSPWWFKDKLYNLFVLGKGPLWEIPKDIPTEYVEQVNANEWREKTKPNGQVEGYWHETGADHFADCELAQLAVADIGGVTRMLPREQETKS